MKIILQRVDEAFHLVARNESGNETHIDASPAIGGGGNGARPMELLIMGLGGCSSIDIILFLKKARLPLIDLRVEINAEREQGVEPALFTNIHAHYTVIGDLPETQVKRAVDLSLEKYCSVARVLEKTAKLTWSFEVLKSPEKSGEVW
ncbi:MAG: OsmC family protein [Blastocatellia bacterium]